MTPMLTNRSSPLCCSGTFIVALVTTTVHFCCPVHWSNTFLLLGHYASTFLLPWPPVVHFCCPGHQLYISVALATNGTFLLPMPPVVHFCCPGHWWYIFVALATSGTFLLPWPLRHYIFVVHQEQEKDCPWLSHHLTTGKGLPLTQSPDNRKRTVLD